MNNIEVVGLGALNIDHIYQVEHSPEKVVKLLEEYASNPDDYGAYKIAEEIMVDDGEAVVNESTLSPGGSAANTIYGLANLGVNTGFTGVVGDDTEGEIMVQDFEKVGVDTSQIRVKHGAKTGSVLCLSDKLNFRSLYVSPGANNLLTMDDLDLNYISRARILHLSSFADDRQFKTLLKLMERLDLSTKVTFAPGALYAVKGLKALGLILARTHVLFTNQDEIQQLTGKDVTTGAESCLKQGCRIVAVTLGKGTKLELGKEVGHRTVTAVGYIRDAANEYIVEPIKQNIVSQADTTGAGDAFTTGFLYGLLRGKGLEECGRLGDIVAQFSITKIGARAGLPTLNELAQRYRELYSEQL